MAGWKIVGGYESVVERTQLLADQHAEAAACAIKQRLDVHLVEGNITPEQLEIIAEHEAGLARELFISERDTGKHNDLESRSKGLVALLTAAGKFAIHKAIQEQRNDHNLENLPVPEFDLDAEISDGPSVHLMSLTEGVFGAIQTTASIAFYRQHLDWQPSRPDLPPVPFNYGPMVVGKAGVIRIECQAGELWQNPHYC